MEESPTESPQEAILTESSDQTTLDGAPELALSLTQGQAVVTESPSQSQEAPAADDAANYLVAEWAGMPQYICIDCGHQTWDLGSTQDHQTRMHFRVMRALTIDRPAATPEAGAPGSESGAGVGTAAGADAAETTAADIVSTT